jgi:hypothetical protein
MTKKNIKIGFDNMDEAYKYLRSNQNMEYVSIDASELFLLLKENQDKIILLLKLKIEGNLEFQDLQFTKSFWFKDCQITGDVYMGVAIFNSILTLDNVCYRVLSFQYATCKDNVRFRNANCKDSVEILGKMSGAYLDFGSAKFNADIELYNCNLDGISFGNNAFEFGKFNNIVIQRCNIDTWICVNYTISNLNIRTSTITALSFYEGTIDDLNIFDSTLGELKNYDNNNSALLYNTTITGSFYMVYCSFLSDINFKNAVFNEVVNFSNTFSTNLKLNDSKFKGILNLNNSRFDNGLNLGTSQFLGGLDLSISQFKKVLDFNDCRIYKFLNWKDACYAGSLGDGIIHHDVNFPDDKVDRPKADYPVCK